MRALAIVSSVRSMRRFVGRCGAREAAAVVTGRRWCDATARDEGSFGTAGVHTPEAFELRKDDTPLTLRCKEALEHFSNEPGFRGQLFGRCGVAPQGVRTQIASDRRRVGVEVYFAVPLVRDGDTLKYLCHAFASMHTQALRPGATVELSNATETEMPQCYESFLEGPSSYVIRTTAAVIDEKFVTLTYKAHHGGDTGPVHMWGSQISRLFFSTINSPAPETYM